ncbi:MAG: hypothetical protein ABMA01_15620 [Chthoniobacteraceae bacterium]
MKTPTRSCHPFAPSISVHPLRCLAAFVLAVLGQLAAPDSYGQSPSYGPQGIVVGDSLLRFVETVESNGITYDSYGSGYWIRQGTDAPGELVWSNPSAGPVSAGLVGYFLYGNFYSWFDPVWVFPSELLANFAAWDPANGPTIGPRAVFFRGRVFEFSHTSASSGADLYLSPLGGQVVIGGGEPTENGYAVFASGPAPIGDLNTSYASGVFTNGATAGPIFGIDNGGNLVGSPTGIVASFPTDPGTVSLELAAGGLSQATYVWQKPDESWGAKVVLSGAPRLFRMHTAQDHGSSPIHYWSGSTLDTAIGGLGNDQMFSWWGSSLAPSAIYVGSGSGVSGLQYTSEWTDSSSGQTNVLYSSGDRELALIWYPNAAVEGFIGWCSYSEYYWDDSGNTGTPQRVLGFNQVGTWDGMNQFTRQGYLSVVISRNAPRQGPAVGPARILWDGIALNFDPNASFMSGSDSYVSADGVYRAIIHANGTAALGGNGVGASGSYDFATRRFSFAGSGLAGVVLGLGVGETLAGDHVVSGSLDVYGSTFDFSTDGVNPNKPAFAWLHEYGPISWGSPNGNHLRWLTATANYEWTWEAPTSPGYYTPLMALRSHPSPMLALSVPITNPVGQVVVGPYNDTAVQPNTGPWGNRATGVFVIGAGTGPATNQRRNAMRVLNDGTVLVRPSGDISMGEFSAGPQP